MGSLNFEGICAGFFLVIFGIFGIMFNSVVCCCMAKLCREITGFRFLLSHTISDILLIIQFALWPGIVILTQDEHIPQQYRWHFHHYLDFTWWAMVWHYMLVALSRFAAIQWPNWFRCLTCRSCFIACMGAWLLGLLQSIIEHQFSSFVPLYYDPTLYGLTADWRAYNKGTSTYYLIMNLTPVLTPIPIYALAVVTYFRRRKRQLVIDGDNHTNGVVQHQLRVEKRLFFPCSINALVFIIEQASLEESQQIQKSLTFHALLLHLLRSI